MITVFIATLHGSFRTASNRVRNDPQDGGRGKKANGLYSQCLYLPCFILFLLQAQLQGTDIPTVSSFFCLSTLCTSIMLMNVNVQFMHDQFDLKGHIGVKEVKNLTM